LFLLRSNDFLGANIHHFAIKKRSQTTWSRENFEKKFKKVVTLQGKNYEIVELFENFGQIYSFILLKLPEFS
jgi:hypothetical protein